MRRLKLVLTIGLLLVLAFWVVIKIYDEPKTLLQRYEVQIEELKGEIRDVEGSIDKYYSQKKRKRPLYPVLEPVKSKKLNDLIQEKLVLQEQLASQYNQIGDYYMYEGYLLDKKGSREYKSYSKYGETTEELEYNLKNRKSLGEKILKVMIDTRIKALNNYNLSTGAVSDISSSLYRLKGEEPILILKFNLLANLILTKGLDELGREIYKNKAFRKKYLAERVNSKVHHKKGKVYRQLAYLVSMVETYFSRLDDQVRVKLMKSFFLKSKKSLQKAHRLLANYQDLQKVFLREAEKELLIALGSDAKNTTVIYDLAELYVYRYEHIVEDKSEFLLVNSKTLISKVNTVKSLFLLARIYYLMAYLEKDQYHRLQKWSVSSVGSFKTPKDLRVYYLKKARAIYEHRLLAILPDATGKKTKSLYEKANANYIRIKEEIYKLSSGR